MTIVFTGGATGGHFYPFIAISEAISDLVREERIVAPSLYFLAPSAFDEKALFENSISFVRVPAGKMRRYFSLLNIFSPFLTLIGVCRALVTLFRLYPDVVISKGGFGSVPTVLAAWLLCIPIIIHESDAKPGRAILFSARFAKKIAISFESSRQFFRKKDQHKIARTGIPLRKALMRLEKEGARQYLKLEESVPTILILGGSLGAMKINEVILSALIDLLSFANIIHQTGPKNFSEVVSVSQVILSKSKEAQRYHPVGYLDEVSLQRSAGVADLVISRAGASAIAEIGLWKKPAILIPIPESISHDQRTNAYSYAETGAAVVLEEGNLTPHVLTSEAKRILSDSELMKKMSSLAEGFTDIGAARILAHEALAIGLSHES
jgi:UDP-N-acetylglucosamine--N-acetylmuramyl-(pentapeptide) pyrophosphoryl-undecaprenol N-acetylglucosamine transferase